MSWFSKVGPDIKAHPTKLSALIRLNFAKNAGGATMADLAIYKRDPRKHPDEPDVFAAMVEKENAKRWAAQIKAIMRGGKKASR